jgi:drug/metabolite transporter (DMT)-like permease
MSERTLTAVKEEPWRLASTTLYLVIVIIAWGTNYPLMKLALEDIQPLTFSVLRLVGGAVVITFLLLISRAPRILPPRSELLPLAGIGILQFASVLGLAGIALLFLPAGRTVTIIYSMPLWAAIFDIAILRVRLKRLQIGGIAISLIGMILFLDPAVIDWGAPGAALGISLAVVAAALWGLGAVLYRIRPWQASLLSQTLWQLLMAAAAIAVAAALIESSSGIRWSTTLWLILIWNWVVPTALAVWAWSKVLSRISPSIAGQLLMCTPFVGIAASAWMFNEDLPPVFAGSAVLIAVGGMLVLIKRPLAGAGTKS